MILEVDGLTHRYGEETAVEDVSFGLESGELVALLGPSGCGKTTIVQAVAGHVRPTAGRVFLRGEDVTDRPPEARRVGVVFQRSTLYPHMTVEENVAYGLDAKEIDRRRRDELVDEYIGLVDLDAKRGAYPETLSGGQRRRVELARALAPQPDVLLLDEPLSALDRALREQLREEIARIQRETGVTTLFVTHDQEEAMRLADRLVVVNDGAVADVGDPRTLYESPETPFIASFLGRSNVVGGTVLEDEPLVIELCGGTVTLPGVEEPYSEGDRITCHVRPSAMSIRSESAGADRISIAATVDDVVDLGRRYDITVRAATGEELLVEHEGQPPAIGDEITITIGRRDLVVFGP